MALFNGRLEKHAVAPESKHKILIRHPFAKMGLNNLTLLLILKVKYSFWKIGNVIVSFLSSHVR